MIDHGIGISNSDLKNLFTPFFVTTDKKSKELNHNGHGLGLSISHKIAKKLCGSLTVESMIGEGTTFTLLLKKEIADELCDPDSSDGEQLE